MTRLFWIFGWAAVILWSLVAWAAYGIVDLFGYLATTGAAEAPALTSVIRALQGLGQTAIVVVWLLVSVAILAVPWLVSRVVGAETRAFAPPPRQGVIDLEPDQYAVRPQQAPPSRHLPPQPRHEA